MNKQVLILFLSSILLCFSVSGQNDTLSTEMKTADPVIKHSGLFESDELLELTLQFDINAFQRKKISEESMPALFTCRLQNGDSIVQTVKLRARGNTRKTVCSFPPIRINFDKSESSGTIFEGLNKVKLVTHCDPGNQMYTLKEYLAYKLYNLVTDYSYRVRLARIKYINSTGRSRPFTAFAFFIEPDEQLSQRTGGRIVSNVKLTQKHIAPEVIDRMAIFNYMIGNTDWSVPINHNITILSIGLANEQGHLVTVPFDFDYAGLVNTSYAVPFEGLGLKSVLERRYLGVCRSREVFLNALNEFARKKEEFLRNINEFPYINEKTKKEMVNYLETFFKGFDKHHSVVNNLLYECITF